MQEVLTGGLNQLTTIRRRLTLYYLVVIAVVVILIGSFFTWFLHYFYMENLRENLYNQALLAASLVDEMIKKDSAPGDIDALCKDLGRELEVRITFIDENGVVLADSDQDPALMDNHADRPEVIEASLGDKGAASRYSATLDEEMYYLAVPLVRERPAGEEVGPVPVVRLALPLVVINRAVTNLLYFLLGALALSSLLALVAAMILSRNITGPIAAISRAANQIAGGNLTPPLRVKGRDELALLAENIGEMGRALNEKMEQLLRQKNKLETVVASMSSGIILADGEMKIEMINPAAEKLFDLKREEVTGRLLPVVVRHHALHENIKAACRHGRSAMMELNTYYPRPAVLETHILPVAATGAGVIGFLLLFHDVTHLRSIEKMRSDFVANVSHEMRTPLTTLRGYTETILHEELTSEQLHDFLSVIERETKNLSRLVDDLLELARIENEKDFVNKEKVALGPLVSEALGRVEVVRSRFKTRLEYTGTAGELYVFGNREWLCRAVINILENSIRHGKTAGQVLVRVAQDSDNATVIIEDDGPGIPEADLPYVFERFYRVDKARSRKSGGTGLGLSIVKHIMEAHGASYALENVEGGGSIFYFTLPLLR